MKMKAYMLSDEQAKAFQVVRDTFIELEEKIANERGFIDSRVEDVTRDAIRFERIRKASPYSCRMRFDRYNGDFEVEKLGG